MAKNRKHVAHFSSDSQLLAELGERLIATPVLALAELVKNAYDADATTCHVWIEQSKRGAVLKIKDNGHGMTQDQFLQNWMRVAATAKLKDKLSRKFKRPLSGSKGVGRFAARKLGKHLALETVAHASRGGGYQLLVADFDWPSFAAGQRIDDIDVPYDVDVASAQDVGTLLEIGSLTSKWDDDAVQELTNEIAGILELPGLTWLRPQRGSDQDPGFEVFVGPPDDARPRQPVGVEVIGRYVGKVRLRVRGTTISLRYEFDGLGKRNYSSSLKRNLIGDVDAEIRFFPKRHGVFSNLASIDGRKARSWLTDRGGVKVFDRGFRMLPYGERYDDWLNLNTHKTERERTWGSTITTSLFAQEKFSTEGSSAPILRLPHNRQLYGAVAVQTFRPDAVDALQPAMDRQGFLENPGYRQLVDVVRCAVEIFAILDVEATAEKKKKEARQQARRVKQDIGKAINRIQQDETIPVSAKRRIVRSYETVANRVGQLASTQEEASRAQETMALLGVLSGFMTHEATVMLRSVERMLGWLRRVPKRSRDDEYAEILEATQSALEQLRGHLDYAETFVRGARIGRAAPFKVKPQVARVLRQLSRFASERGIELSNVVPTDLLSPRLSVSVFSGVLLNLVTNAIKAVIARATPAEQVVQVDATRLDNSLVLWVSDTGVGVPEELRDRIFEPLFSTTEESPLGVGMGLGLSIVRRLVRELRGRVAVVSPADGFTSCFEVQFPYD